MVSRRSHRSFTTYWQHMLAVIVVPLVAVDTAYPKEAFELLQTGQATGTLGHNKPRSHLKAESVAASARPIALSDEADREAAFSVYKPNNPA